MEIQGLRWDKRALPQPQCGWVRMQGNNLVWLLSTQTYTTCVSSEWRHTHHVNIKDGAKWSKCQILDVCSSVLSKRKKLLMTDSYVKRKMCCYCSLAEENCVQASQTQHFMQLHWSAFAPLVSCCDLCTVTSLMREGERPKETKTCTSSRSGWLQPLNFFEFVSTLCFIRFIYLLVSGHDRVSAAASLMWRPADTVLGCDLLKCSVQATQTNKLLRRRRMQVMPRIMHNQINPWLSLGASSYTSFSISVRHDGPNDNPLRCRHLKWGRMVSTWVGIWLKDVQEVLAQPSFTSSHVSQSLSSKKKGEICSTNLCKAHSRTQQSASVRWQNMWTCLLNWCEIWNS